MYYETILIKTLFKIIRKENNKWMNEWIWHDKILTNDWLIWHNDSKIFLLKDYIYYKNIPIKLVMQ